MYAAEYWYVGHFVASAEYPDWACLDKPTTGPLNPVIDSPLSTEDLCGLLESLKGARMDQDATLQLLEANGKAC